jgi:hypothetical protein
MRVCNTHQRALKAPPGQAAALLDALASPADALWPKATWPRMHFDRPLQVGATGGHGPIRYTVVAFEPGRSVAFRFTAPRGFEGGHRFEVVPQGEGSQLIHMLEMNASGFAAISWPLVFRPLHDALVEDGLSNAQRHLGEPALSVPWTLWVRLLRRLVAPLARRRR